MKNIRLNLMIKTFIAVTLAILVGMLSPPTWAVLTIEITGGDDTGIPIAVVPFHFQGQQRPSEDIRQIVSADLYRTGQFLSLSPSEFLSRPSSKEQVRFKNWRLIKAEALVIGQVKQVTNNQFEVTFYLFDVYKEITLEARRWTVGRKNLRNVAHQISDYVYEALTGIPGDFDTRIAYVTLENSGDAKLYQLMVSDSDGQNAEWVLKTNEPILSPAWAPDAKRLAYVTFDNRRSGASIWVLDTRTGKREKAYEGGGTASAPAWSPDGRRLAIRLSRAGNHDIYIIDIASSRLIRLTRHPAIDTEPAWSPDGRNLVFTSDRTGRPQIFRISAGGGSAERLTRAGRENAGASYSPNGKHLVMVTNHGNGDQIGVFYADSGELKKLLTDGPLDDSPTYSPNGAMIMYAKQRRNQGVLAAVSADGRIKQILMRNQGEVREPAWSSRKQ